MGFLTRLSFIRFIFFSLGLVLLPSQWRTAATVAVQIGQNFTASTFGIDSSAVPPDCNGAVGPSHFVELINGRYAVFNKSDGSSAQSLDSIAFWKNAGVTIASTVDVTDPRIVFDSYSQRWFASMVDVNITARRQRANHFLLAVSDTSDPTGVWHGFAFTADPLKGYFADFPALGVDANGVYLSGDLFDRNGNPIGPTLVSIPKSDLLANPPSVARRTSLGILSYGVRGDILQPAMTTGLASTPESVLAMGDLGFDLQPHSTLIASTIQTVAGLTNVTLTAASVLTVPDYEVPINPPQPDGSDNLDDGDARLSASVRRVGDIIYAVHSVQTNNRAALRWYKIDAVQYNLIQAGTITDVNLDLFYPSIAANEIGTVVIGCNGSSADVFVSCYSVVGETVNGVLNFGDLILLKAGEASYQTPDYTDTSRWGDYSATVVDPSNPNRFWTIQAYPIDTQTWATQIIELITGPPPLNIAVNEANVQISWQAASGLELQYSSDLSPLGNWAPVAQMPNITDNHATVLLPISATMGFFRLAQTQ